MNQHERVLAKGANSKYDPEVLSPLDRALRVADMAGRKVLGFERSGKLWKFKLMRPKVTK